MAINWDAISAMERAGYRANPDGTITDPQGRTLAGSTGGDASRVIRRTSTRTTDRAARNRAGASIRGMLAQYGLQDLARYVDRWVRDGLSWEEIEVQLRDPKTAAGKVFDQRFPEIRMRSEKGLRPMSVQEIQSYREQARQVMRNAGLPKGFYDDDRDLTEFMVNDVSPQELEQRVMDGYVAVMQAPAEVRSELERMYGVSSGELVAYMLDPDRATTVIQRNVAAARVGGAATRTGFGQVSREEAERIGALGVTDAQAEQGFGTLSTNRELTVALDRGEDVISREEQIGAVFEGNAAAGERLSRRARRRQAQFQGGGSLATSREGGFSGLSTAR